MQLLFLTQQRRDISPILHVIMMGQRRRWTKTISTLGQFLSKSDSLSLNNILYSPIIEYTIYNLLIITIKSYLCFFIFY